MKLTVENLIKQRDFEVAETNRYHEFYLEHRGAAKLLDALISQEAEDPPAPTPAEPVIQNAGRSHTA